MLLSSSNVSGQEAAWQQLAKPDQALRGNVVACEEAIDLVRAWVADSVLDRRKQRHKGFGGWMGQRVIGLYWEYFDAHKRTYIGTSSRPFHIFDGVADEVDINIFIMPHLAPYMEMARKGFEEADARPRSEKGFRVQTPDQYKSPEEFPLPEEIKVEQGYITIECEVTPQQEFAEELAKKMMPSEDGDYSLDTVPNFGTKYPSFGMTGVWCMDCNHNCRPEIHPIEWLWWLDLSAERPGSPNAKSWMVSLLCDGSNRFHKWSPSPLGGEIALPFILPKGESTLKVNIDWLVGDPVPVADSLWQNGPRNAQELQTAELEVPLNFPGAKAKAQIHSTAPNALPNVRYWFTPAGGTTEGGDLRGFLHMSVMVKSLGGFRATFDH
ncbi:MAG: hypothetical protein U0176_04260 [Bacteroidia bacterium]